MFGSVRCVVALASTLVVAGALSARAEPRGADDGTVLVDAIVASVDGAPFTLVDLEQYERGAGQLLPPSERESRSSMLDALVLSKLFQAEFDKKGIRASDSDVDIYIDNVVRESGTSRDEIKRSLAEIGLTWDQYFERARQELQRMALLNREIRARVNVTPEEVERTWREDPQYSTPERMEAFSPDGKWVVFTAYFDKYGDDHGCEIYVIRTDGTDLRRLTDNDYCDYQPRWGL